MVFVGLLGVGKMEIVCLIGDICQGLKVLCKGYVVEIDCVGFVVGYIGQIVIKILEKCCEVFDGILFIDEVYMFVFFGGVGLEFGKEVIDMLLKFMEDNCDCIIVIVVGYCNEMWCFIESNFGLVSCFSKMIDFLFYFFVDFCEMFRWMVVW